MVVQYPDTLNYDSDVTIEYNEWNQPIEVEGVEKTLIGRYENYAKGGFKEYTGKDGTSILADGVYYAQLGQELPNRYDIITIPTRDMKAQILHVYKGQLNYTIYIKELK